MEAGGLPVNQRAELERMQVTAAGRGMRMVGVPIGTDEYQKYFATEVAMVETAKLLRMLVKMENVPTSFQVVLQSEYTLLTFLLQTLPPSSTTGAAEKFDTALEWSLASMIVRDGAAKLQLASPVEVASVQTRASDNAVGTGSAESGRPSRMREGSWPHRQRRYQGSGLHGMPSPSRGQRDGNINQGGVDRISPKLPDRAKTTGFVAELKRSGWDFCHFYVIGDVLHLYLLLSLCFSCSALPCLVLWSTAQVYRTSTATTAGKIERSIAPK